MTRDKYIFDDASGEPELHRLRLLESVFDEKTRRCLLSTGPLEGRSCLEVGAGAGSIAAWMNSQVGPTGAVMAVDNNARFLRDLPHEVHVVDADISCAALPAGRFDLAHARYVLIHNTDARPVLGAMLRAVKSGGYLALEEPDFSAAAPLIGPAELNSAFENVKHAMKSMFSSRGMNYAFGGVLPALVREFSVDVIDVEYDCPVEPGASMLAEMMRLSTLSLENKYLATGCATATDIARYAEFAESPDCWGIYYATVRVLARKRAE
jgi:ubiquinone/menaquinone biosynthesis C-methylase UbiE